MPKKLRHILRKFFFLYYKFEDKSYPIVVNEFEKNKSVKINLINLNRKLYVFWHANLNKDQGDKKSTRKVCIF